MSRDADPDYMGVSSLNHEGTEWSLGHNGSLSLVGLPTAYLGKRLVVIQLTVKLDSRLYLKIKLSSVLGFEVSETDQPGVYHLEYEVRAISSVKELISGLFTAAAVIRGRFLEAWETLDSIEFYEMNDTVETGHPSDVDEYVPFDHEPYQLPLSSLLR